MLSSLLGVRLMLMMGETVPRPAPAEIMNAVQEVQVTDDLGSDRGFQLTLHLDKNRRVNYPLLDHPLLTPFTRVVVAVVLGAKLEVLMDGVLDHYRINPGQGKGNGTLTVFGKDLTALMALEDRNQSFENQSSSSIVSQILGNYSNYGISPAITSTDDQVSVTERVRQQTRSNLEWIQELGNQHGFIFFLEPITIGKTLAYWGPRNALKGPAQPALTTNFGAHNNVRSLQFTHNTQSPLQAEASVLDPTTGETIPVSAEDLLDSLQPLAARPTPARRRVILREVLQIFDDALREVRAAQTEAPDSVTVNGEVDTVRYGHILRSQRTVGVRGAGLSFDGNYRVNQVTHRIRQGQYTQSFSLSRNGLGAIQPTVRV